MSSDTKPTNPLPPGRGEAGTERLSSLGPVSYRFRRCRLQIVSGPDAGSSNTFESASVRIGSRADCEMCLTDTAVSRVHCVLELARDGYKIRDEGSKNGTCVDGVRVCEAYLKPGAAILVGRTRIVFDVQDEQIAAPPVPSSSLHGLFGQSASMRQIFGVIERLGSRDISILIGGETGTGKEVAARALHCCSPRASAPFVVFDCANTDRELIRSELFGHEAGAFTGATGRRQGAFERAHTGTLFLDELGELPLDLQPRLLRVLQDRRVTRLGGSAEIPVDVRMIAATNRELSKLAQEGTFREDLYYRIAQVTLRLPALRERREDIGKLAGQFLSAVDPGRSFSEEVSVQLSAMSWPGNVRELKNWVEAVAALTDSPVIGPGEVKELGATLNVGVDREPRPEAAPVGPGPPVSDADREGGATLDEVERSAIAGALATYRGNISRTAESLGISRVTLRAKIRKYGLGTPRDR